MAEVIDLNCDMGESFGAWRMGEDEAMLGIVSSANIACGFHAGDPGGIRRTLRLARAQGVGLGAHPGFADLYGFGRRRIQGDSPEDLEAQLVYQIAAVAGLARLEGGQLAHVKLHGALSNMAATDAGLARICARAVRRADPGLIYVTQPHSRAMQMAEAEGLRVAAEVFADRGYAADGTLLPRGAPGALIEDPERSLEQVLEMVLNGRIPVQGGRGLGVEAATVCVHGDTPGAVGIARGLRQGLERQGVQILRLGAA